MRTRPHRNPNIPPIEADGAHIRPLHDRVVVRRLPVPAFSPGGLIIRPEHKSMKSDRARVVAAGPGRTLDDGTLRPMHVKMGDIIVMPMYQALVVTVDREELVILREDEICAVEDPENLSDEAKAGIAAEQADEAAA